MSTHLYDSGSQWEAGWLLLAESKVLWKCTWKNVLRSVPHNRDRHIPCKFVQQICCGHHKGGGGGVRPRFGLCRSKSAAVRRLTVLVVAAEKMLFGAVVSRLGR